MASSPGTGAPPNTVNHEGLLLDADGLPVERAVDLTVALYATADGATIQGVTYFVDEVVEAQPAPEIPKAFYTKLEELELSLQINQQKQALILQEEQYLNQLQAVSTKMPDMFSATTRDGEDVEVTAFAPEKAMEVFEYMFERRAAIGAKKIELTTEATKLSRQVKIVRDDMVQFQKDNPAIGREFDRRALVSLTASKSGKVTVYLNYLVQNVRWSPTYTARGTTGNQSIQFDYDAFVFQDTGEDWTSVELTLATASPDMWSEPPVLKPLWVDLASYEQAMDADGEQVRWVTAATGVGMDIGSAELKQDLADNMRHRQNVSAAPHEESEGDGRYYGAKRDSSIAMSGRTSQVVLRQQVAQYDYTINDLANKLQAMDIVVGESNGVVMPAPTRQESISVEYELAGKVSIPSRPEQMVVKVSELQLTGEVGYVAVPLLTSQVFRETELTNTSELALLPGPVNSYLDEKFVGSGDLEAVVSQGEQFALGFGVDSQLEVNRVLVDRTESESWGKTRLKCEYKISLTNYKAEAVTVLVKDRLPSTENTGITLQSLNSSQDQMADAYFVEYLKPLGMLRWSVDVPAGAQRADVKTVTYDYTLEYDKEMHIALPTAVEATKREHEVMPSSDRMMRW